MTDLAQNPDRWRTWGEINAQPAIWRDWLDGLAISRWKAWIGGLEVEEIWFCGAGSSAYIGDIIAAGAAGANGAVLRAVPSTDLVSRPAACLSGRRRVLIVNFGRSGNSTETIGTLDALDALAPDWPRLNITCNAQGALATRGPGKALVLPDACHDRGFAMTSSFTTMLLTALALFDTGFDAGRDGAGLAAAAAAFLARGLAPAPPPRRAVYVGAGPLAFAARECALKVMELSGGQVPALWDSTLGFRHGPKAFAIGDTAIHVLLSADGHAAKYDRDLVAELRQQLPEARVTAIGPGGDIDIGWPDGACAAALAVMPAQIQAVTWADALGLNADDPFKGQGTLTRVVDGVRLHRVVA